MQQFSSRRFLSVVVGMLSVGLVLTIAVSTPSIAQGPKVNAAPDSKRLVWEGPNL